MHFTMKIEKNAKVHEKMCEIFFMHDTPLYEITGSMKICYGMNP